MLCISYLIYNDGAKVLIFSEITKGYCQISAEYCEISATEFQIRAEYCAIRATKFSYGASNDALLALTVAVDIGKGTALVVEDLLRLEETGDLDGGILHGV